MKKTQRTDAIKNIRKRIVSFLSIVVIVMFGIGGSFATRYLGAGINKTASDFYSRSNFMDYEIVSSLGMRDFDIETVKGVEGVTEAEGVISLDGNLNAKDIITDVKIITVTEKINIPEISEGRLPSAPDECALSPDIMKKAGISVGDSITLTASFGDKNPLVSRTYTVTGKVNHPYYLRKHNTFVALVPFSSFDQDVVQGLYTSVLVKTDKPIDSKMFDKESEADIAMQEKLWQLAYSLQEKDLAHFKQVANDRIDEEWAKAEQMLNEAKQQISDGEKELNDTVRTARTQIADARKQLDLAKGELLLGEKQIEDGTKQLQTGKEQIKKGDAVFSVISPDLAIELLDRAAGLVSRLQNAVNSQNPDLIESARNAIKDFLAEENVRNILAKGEDMLGLPITSLLEEASNGVLLENLSGRITDATNLTRQYIQAKKDMPGYEKQLEDAKKQVKEGWDQYNANLELVNNNEKLLNQKEAEGRKQLEDAKAELNEKEEDALKKVELARKEADNLEVNLIVQGRMGNLGYLDIYSNVKSVQTSGIIFGALFTLITALVCFSTLAIMVEEDKKTVGTTKAFGFYNREILGKYLIYGVLSAFLGAILGAGLAYVIEIAVARAITGIDNYVFGPVKTVVTPKDTLIAIIAVVLLCSIVTVISCMSLLKTPASLLMKGETTASRNAKQKNGKFSPKGGTLYSRLIFKNMLDEKARVLITILIVAVSTGIIATGITLKLSFDGMFEKQLNDIFKYDVRVVYTKDVTEDMVNEVRKVLDGNGTEYLEACYEPHLYNKDKNNVEAFYVVAADPDRIEKFIHIEDSETGETLRLPEEGIIVQQKFAERGTLVPGNEFRILDNTLNYHTAKVAGSFRNYQGRLVMMSVEAYRNIFTEKPVNNCFYILLNGTDEALIKNKLAEISPNLSIESSGDFVTSYESIRVLYNMVVLILTGMAVIMSFMILTNLANIFIARKKKELIVMRINGFSIKQTVIYLARETVITVLTGLLLGTFLGLTLGKIAITYMEPVEIMFDRTFKPASVIISVGLEALFSFIINALVFRKIKSLNFRDVA